MPTLTTEQQNAVAEIVGYIANPAVRCCTLSGGSGVGKTTVIKEIQKQWEFLAKLDSVTFKHKQWVYTAITNKAADVLRTTLNQPVATTASALGLILKANKLVIRGSAPYYDENSVFFVDETSFLDEGLYDYITHNVKGTVVFIGDECQLPPVKGVMAPIFNEYVMPQVKLTKVMRQADGNPIQELSYKLRESVLSGEYPDAGVNGTDILYLDSDDFLKAFMEDCKALPTGTVRALTWTNHQAQNYNLNAMQACSGRAEMRAYDIVEVNTMVTTRGTRSKPAYRLTTGSIVTITNLGAWEKDENGITSRKVQLDNAVWFRQAQDTAELDTLFKNLDRAGELDRITHLRLHTYIDLRYMYASTINKAQGSSYDVVYLDLDDISNCPDPNTVARLLYVGATRARTKLVFTGDI